MRRKVVSFIVAGLAMVGCSAGTFAQQSGGIAEIGASVTSGFGVYTPYVIPRYRADVGLNEPTVTSGFSNVATASGSLPWNNFFSAGERALLQQNNFVVRPEPFGSFGEAYGKSFGSQELGAFITVDAVMHGLRVTIDEAQRQIERDYMAPTLASVLGEIAVNLNGQLSTERDPAIAIPLQRLLAYVQTAHILLDESAPVNSRVRDAVEAELQKIRAARGVAVSSIVPDRRVDYARFAPTGHYTINEQFKDYHRAITWLSEVGLGFRESGGNIDPVETRMAALLARSMDALGSQGDFRARYMSVYEMAAFFSGRSEQDITWDMMGGSVRGFYGKLIAANAGSLADDTSLVDFVVYTEQQLPQPVLERGNERLFRLLSRGVSPSQALLARNARVIDNSHGLTLMAALAGHEPSANRSSSLREPVTLMRKTFTSRPAEEWVQSLSWSVLYTMQSLTGTEQVANGYPRFMRTGAWRDRQLMSALGAWADFEHGVNMLPMQTVKVSPATVRRGSDLQTTGYVEPHPEAWARVASLAGYVRDGLMEGKSGAVMGTKLEAKLRDIENVSALLMQIAAAELSGAELTDSQFELISGMRARIAAYETFVDRSLKEDGAAIVAGTADAAAVAGSAKPSTGNPLAIYVIVPRNDGVGGLMLTRGAVYSYFETDLDDAEWERTITSSSGKMSLEMPWTKSFLSGDRAFNADAGKFQAIEGSLTSVASYVPTKAEKKRALPNVELKLESNVVRRSGGELWYTIDAPQMGGAEVMVIVVNTAGREVYRTNPGRIADNGTRYDLVRVEDLPAGQYFVRVTDNIDRMLASGRFLVVR